MPEISNLGRYQLRRVLGKGAMGVVYEGFDPTLNRRVAVKTILKSVAIDAETAASYSARFIREAQAVARLNHPHIVQVHDFGEHDEVAYLVMEFIEGRELRALFDAGEKIDPAEAVRIMGELLDALDFAHERGVIHRDIKPANVMLDSQRRVKLADFGVARIQDSDRSLAGTMVGTPAFMSPEQIKGGKIDGRTDIFSAGTLLYQLLTGEQPFKGEGAWTVAKKIVEDDPPPPSSVLGSVPPAFDAVVKKALAKLPAQRFAKARDLAMALRGALATSPEPAAVPKTRQPTKAEIKASETELEFWRSIQNRDDLDELQLYVDEFPNGAYTQLARLKLAKLREPLEAARKQTEEKARAEAEARERERKAEEKARREAKELAKRQAEEKARREAEERVKREAAERAKREAEAREKAKREAEEKARQAQALARLKAQEEARAKAKAVAIDADATVALGKVASPAEPKKSLVIPIVIAAVVIAGAGAAYLVLKRPSAPEPVQVAEKPAPPRPAPPAVDVEKIKREAEERVRREYADKSAAEQAAAAKVAAEKAIAEKQAATKAAADKAAADKLAADKVAAERATAEKAAANRMAAEKAAAEKLAAEKATAEKAAAERVAAEKLAAEKAAAEKAAAAKAAAAAAKPGWPSVGDRWVYEARDSARPERRYEVLVELKGAGASGLREEIQISGRPAIKLVHQKTVKLISIAPGNFSFVPYLAAFNQPREGMRWSGIGYDQIANCSGFCDFSAEIVGKERVTVGAGTYDAWKIVVTVTRGSAGSGGAGIVTYWFAESVKRVVKYQARVDIGVNNYRWTDPDVDMELVSYIPATAK